MTPKQNKKDKGWHAQNLLHSRVIYWTCLVLSMGIKSRGERGYNGAGYTLCYGQEIMARECNDVILKRN